MRRKLTNSIFFGLVLALILVGAAEAFDLNDPDIVAYWPFDEGSGTIATDQSQNSHDGTLNGGVTWVDGVYGKALQFNGSDAYVATGQSFLNNLDGFTLAGWVSASNIGSYTGLFGQNDLIEFGFTTENGGQLGVHMSGNGWQYFGANYAFPYPSWHHLALAGDASRVVIYIDGQEAASDEGGMVSGSSGFTFNIGAYVFGESAQPLLGEIDDVSVFSRALTQEEIQILMLGFAGYPYASSPSPDDGALYADTWASLSWKAGDSAVSHNVYMGDNFDEVNEGTGDTFIGNVPENNMMDPYIIVGITGYPLPEGLAPGTTYYWRVDEVNDADPNSPWKGDVWSFWFPSKKAYDPNPTDGTVFIDPSVTLTWTAGFRAGPQHVYFGDNAADVEAGAGGTYKGLVTSTSYVPGALELDKTYYWRVGSTGGVYGDITGDVWSFTTTIPGLGTVVSERWEDIDTTDLDTLKQNFKYPNNPDVTEVLTQFSTTPNLDQYGGRIHGWVYVPGTGDYTFWLCSDNEGELWLSTDDDAANVKLIAQETDWLPAYTWRTGEEQSNPIPLQGGEKYYIMALWKEADGGDHCQVAWRGPGVPTITIIPGSNLSPYEPLNAYGARPSNRAVGVTQTPVLEWRPGIQAASHEVYFGTDEDAVKNATTASPEHKSTKDLGDESYDPGKLDWESTFYWRIDEVNNLNPDSPWVGSVWSFTTADYAIVDDIEDYDAEDQIWWNWLDGLGYIDAGGLVHAGNGSGSEVGDPATSSFTEETIVHGGSQSMPYWYNNSGSTGKFNYSEAKLTLTNTRNWTEGGVKALSLWFQGRPASAGSFVESPPGAYTMTGSGTDITGPSDEFHYAYKMLNGPGTIVARVESVENTNDWAKAGVMIRETLDAGSAHAMSFVTPANGAVFEYRPGVDQDNVGNAGQVAGVTAPYWVKLERDIAQNFTAFASTNGSTWEPLGIPSSIQMAANVYIGLALTSHSASATCEAVFSNVTITGQVSGAWMNQDIGIQSNAAEPMYVAIANSAGAPAVVYHDDPDAAQIDTWTEWNVDLKEFHDKGINLADVNSIAIGFGDRNNPQAGGAGKMYFDDFRLYRPRYIPGMGTPVEADFNSDGIVDNPDLEIMCSNWLDAPVAPNPANLVARYEFENNVLDSAGTNHGTANGFPSYAAGIDGQAISLDGVDDYVSVAGVGISGAAPRTIAGWARADVTEMGDWTNVFGFTGPSENGGHFDIQYVGDTDSSTHGYYGIHMHGDEYDIIPVDLDWHHLAATYDGTTTYYYGDGGPMGSATYTIDTPGAVHIGKREDNTNFFPGSVDDVRIYDYALSSSEIFSLAGGSPLDLNGDMKINFKDYAMLVDQWLEEQLWPEW
jgi:hypothetical protein